MTAAPFLADLNRRGIRLTVDGLQLRVRGKLTPEDADLLRMHKREIIALLTATERAKLPAVLVHRLSVDDIAACADLSADTLAAYLRLLDRGTVMDAGQVPPGFTAACYCEGCGPVWLWPGCPERVRACPWCWRKKSGKRIPRP